MCPELEEMTTLKPVNDTLTARNTCYSRQNSSKRRNSDNDEKNDFIDILHKRGRSKSENTIVCPVADFGCLRNISEDNLSEHYSSKLHQECIMKAVVLFLQQLNGKSKCSTTSLNNERDYSEIVESLDILTEGVSCLHDENVQIHSNVVQLYADTSKQQKQIDQLKNSVEETIQIAHAAQVTNTILETEIETIKQMMMDLSHQSSNNGTFIWKISNVAQKFRDAAAEKQTSIYSPPFYSSPTGYKMCMRLYLNGDGQARKSHLSLFFVLMRGDYDAILQWPFPYKITFCLYDQTSNQRHIIDSFRPDVKSNSFQQPRSNMNIASGIPQFCPLPLIQQDNNPYVRDDCMFIRCMVDLASTPKAVIPYVCSVNPGLPISIQQTMIQAEIERRNLVTLPTSNSQIPSEKTNDLK